MRWNEIESKADVNTTYCMIAESLENSTRTRDIHASFLAIYLNVLTWVEDSLNKLNRSSCGYSANIFRNVSDAKGLLT